MTRELNLVQEFRQFLLVLKPLFTIRLPDIHEIFLKNKRLIYWFIISLLINSVECFGLVISKPFYGINGILFKAIIQILLIFFFCSDFIECILRKCENVRRVATKTEKERLYSLFQEVYQKALSENSLIGKDVRLYIVDSMEINAFVIGRNTLAITRGALKMLNDDELKGIMAHEFGHLSNFDGVITILINFCTIIYLCAFVITSFILSYLQSVLNGKWLGLIGELCGIINTLIKLPVIIIYHAFLLIISGGSRKSEYRADYYACKLGYQEQLKSALYKLYNMQISDKKRTLIENLERNHPILAYRIERLEDC